MIDEAESLRRALCGSNDPGGGDVVDFAGLARRRWFIEAAVGLAPPDELAALVRSRLERGGAGVGGAGVGASSLGVAADELPPLLRSLVDRLRSPSSVPDAAARTTPGFRGAADDTADESAPWAVGDEIAGYRIVGTLGEGGMGVVLLAEDVKLRRSIALKVMKPKLAADETFRRRFLREAQAVASVHHDCVMPIYQVGETDGVLFLAMPYFAGETLYDRMMRSWPGAAELTTIGRRIASGLAAAHDAGVVHRDVKPSNIWLHERDRRSEGRFDGAAAWSGGAAPLVKLLDFGLARFVEDVALTQSGYVVGTPAYMAPEQASGQPVDGRADLFALGTVLYEATTRRRPFRGENTLEVLHSLAVDEPPPPHELDPSIPEPLSRLIAELLEKSP
ncbi:MAG: serine/threonine-protein kinase, partial [Planctomycetia bacterium]